MPRCRSFPGPVDMRTCSPRFFRSSERFAFAVPVMRRLGLSLIFTNIVFHSSIPEILAPSLDFPNRHISVNNDSLDEESVAEGQSSRKAGLFKPKQSTLNGTFPARTITKCCPWGMAFDVNSLTCKESSSANGRLREQLRSTVGRDFSFGVPDCSGKVLYSVVTYELDPDVNALPEERCVDEGDDGSVVVTCGDPEIICKTRPCIRKCKPLGEYYGENANGTEEKPFSPTFYNLTTLKPEESVTVSRFGILFGLDCEEGKIRLDNEKLDVNFLGTNGSLYAPGHREFYVFTANEFCIEYVQNEGIFTFLCPPIEEEKTESVESYVLLALGFIASCICLLATLVVYLCSRMSKSLYGKTLMFYVGCLCIAYLSLAIVHLGNHYLKKQACVLLGYSILLSFLAAFFWLNVMSVDIWKTFRSLRAAEWNRTPENRSRFTAYSVYAWGLPLAITLICGMLDSMPDSSGAYVLNLIRPNIGSSSCWFSRSSYGMYVFFVAPVSLIITCNVILYVNTAWRCWRVKADINKLGVHSGRSKGKYSVHRDQLILNGKLFIVMGVSWGPEFISTILPHPLWKITDAMNTLLGVFIFIIFVMKKKMINNVSQRVRHSLRSFSKAGESTDFQGDLLKRKKVCVTGLKQNIRTCTTNI